MEWRLQLLKIFGSKVKLSLADQEALLQPWNVDSTLQKNDFLIQPGQVEDKLFYIISGTMRIFFPHRDEEICVGFCYDTNLACAYPSFIYQQPSTYAIQALSKTSVVAIRRNDFYRILDEHPAVERAWRMLEEDALIGKIERETEMLTYTPEERYKRLMERSPHLFQIVPRKYIASYLRMTPETLSRIKA